jgi:NADH-quinone oxidoreductase subunit C
VGTPPRSLRSSERVDPEEFSRRVAGKLGDSADSVDVRNGTIHVSVPAPAVVGAARTLRDDPELDCAYFTFLSAIDWEADGFEVLVVLATLSYGNTVVVHVRLPAESPSMASLTAVFGGANWHERECAEMFGITFDGHPNLVKLYLPEDFEGYPLRRSFKLASRRYKAWPGAKDEEEAAAGGPLR